MDSTATSDDEWKPFARLSVVVICRSIIFYGLNTFIPLYWIGVFNQSKTVGSTALTVLFSVGVIGTLIGGRLADRYGHQNVVRMGFASLIPLLLVFAFTDSVQVATALLIPIGLALFAPYSPMVLLGQKYLPSRMGLASGVTLGLAISIGGIVVPLLGWLADKHGLQIPLIIIASLPIITTIMAMSLTVPRIERAQATRNV